MGKLALIIDGDEYATGKLEEYLKTLGFQTTTNKSGQIGLATLRTQRPDIIILAADIRDLEPSLFMERKGRMVNVEKTPVIVLARTARDLQLKFTSKKAPVDFIRKPVMLELLRKKINTLLEIPEEKAPKHLAAEVFIRDGIVVIELRGSLVLHELVSLKYWVLDTARSNQTLCKRFYMIIYELDKDTFSTALFEKLFDFVQFFPDIPKSNIKILTSDTTALEGIKASRAAAGYETVDNYIQGLDKLKALYLAQGDDEIPVEFLEPNAALYKNVYDQHGRVVKEAGKSFTQEELGALIRRGTKKLYYTRRAQVGADSQIAEDENVDVVMDSIQVTGAVIPEGLKELFGEQEAKKRFSVSILVVHGDESALDSLYDFFNMKGFNAMKSRGSKEAFELTSRNRFDYIIVDLDMEGENGLNLVKTLKLRPEVKGTQFIVTAKTVRKQDVDLAVGLGIRGFLKSPFDFEKLSGMIGERTP